MKKLKCIDALTLKIFAMAFMLCDHMWATVFSNCQILTDIGRLAFPIFAFQIVEGYFHTSNFKRLMGRMLLFACISELPFNLLMGGELIYPYHQNVMFTFLIALAFVHLMETAKKTGKKWKFILAILVSTIGGFVLGTVCMVDYFGFGVLTVFIFYWFREFPFAWVGQLVGIYIINMVFLAGLVLPVTIGKIYLEIPQQGFALLSLIFIWLYNGKQGAHNKPIQVAYYLFYPAHMLILSLIALYVMR